MNKFQKSLLGMASFLALTAGQKSAEAALPPADEGAAQNAVSLAGYSTYADPLFELMKRTNGSVKQQAVESAIREMYADPSPAQIESAPELIVSLAELGAPSEVVTKSRDVLIELVSRAGKIDDNLKETAETKLKETVAKSFKLATHRVRPELLVRPNKHQPIPPETGQITGQGVGGASPYPSDVRLKHNVVLLRHLDSGLGLYRFSYNGSDKTYVGVMAQEVQALMPEAVECDSDGYLRVHYDVLGIKMQTWEEWLGSDQTRH